ncbi:hypothetical protein J7643_18645 [bacterium]|nr:hypothetical protein [bacterium]
MHPIAPATAHHGSALCAFMAAHAVGSAHMRYRVDRSPDYFALCRVQGQAHRVLVAEAEGEILGTLSVIADRMYLEAVPEAIAYTADLRVAQAARGTGLADGFMREGIHACRDLNGPETPIFTAVMADNPVGFKKNTNLARDGLVTMRPIADVDLRFLLPFRLPLTKAMPGVRVRAATPEDLGAMAALWERVAAKRPLARAFTPDELEAWITRTPGLGWERFLLAFDRDERLLGFLGVWNQRAIRRFVLEAESPSQRLIRQAWNAGRGIFSLAPFPKPGEPLSFCNVVNLCMPIEAGAALPLLLDAAFEQVRAQGGLFLGLALDRRDPLGTFLKPFFASTSHLCLLGNERFLPLDDPRSPVYHVEISLG